MPFQNGVMFQMLIVAASSVVAQLIFNLSDLQNDPICTFMHAFFSSKWAVTGVSLSVNAGLRTS